MASNRLDDTDEDFAGLTDAELVAIRQGTLDEIRRLRPTTDELIAALPDDRLCKHLEALKEMDGDFFWMCLSGVKDQAANSPESEVIWNALRQIHDSYLVQVALKGQVESEMDGRMREMLRRSRQVLGISLKDVARLAGTHSKHIEKIEQGQSDARAAWFFEQICTEGNPVARKLPLNLRLWSPLADPRLCRTIRKVTINPAWLVASDGAALVLARAIREGRSFDRLPELGEVLQAAGCDDRTILDHCQNPGLHAVGCWVVDALVRAGRSA